MPCLQKPDTKELKTGMFFTRVADISALMAKISKRKTAMNVSKIFKEAKFGITMYLIIVTGRI